MRQSIVGLAVALLLMGGCRGTNVTVMGVALKGKHADGWVSASDLTKDERQHAAVIIGLAIGGTVAAAVAAN